MTHGYQKRLIQMAVPLIQAVFFKTHDGHGIPPPARFQHIPLIQGVFFFKTHDPAATLTLIRGALSFNSRGLFRDPWLLYSRPDKFRQGFHL